MKAMNSSLLKSLLRSIRNTLGRYIAVVAIIALGVGLFAGLKVSRMAMVNTYAAYADESGLYDFRLLSSYGFTDGDVEAFGTIPAIGISEGNVSTDALISNGQSEAAYRVYAMPEKLNTIQLTEGRLPAAAAECVGDAKVFSADDIGRVLTVSKDNTESVQGFFTEEAYVIVGLAISPLYINAERAQHSLATEAWKVFCTSIRLEWKWGPIRTFISRLTKQRPFTATHIPRL